MMNQKSFIYRRSALTLLEIGAFNFAREFWRHEIQSYLTSLISTSSHGIKIDSLLNHLYPKHIPNSIRELANKHIMLLKTEIDEWTRAKENCDVRYRNATDIPVIFTNFDDIVWFGDFTINYEKTAKNIMYSFTVDDWQKFSIACGYYFEHEIEILGKHLFPSFPHIDINPRPYPLDLAFLGWFSEHPGMYFIFLKEHCGDLQYYQTVLLERILCLPSPKNQAGCEALWDCIESNWQLYGLKRCIERKRRFNFYHVFPKLSTQQWRELVTTFGASLMIFLMNENEENFSNAKKPDYVLQVWKYICNMVSGEHFTAIIQDILKTCDLCHKFYEDCWHKEIWISAPEEIKQVALSNLMATVSGKMFISRFFILVLDLANFEQREEFCRINEEILNIDYSESDLRRILGN